ncbi:hypothetical protein [Campylobacter lanienae]|uniref:hypothetical protein n=1 Tax=Campylobacter lanienae TaxID=75658 RepID=UPI002A911C30|nr:hypothetical protein [Campylobacter lanienae]MDY5519192.1 hypothetical protein [Campylobacter lanienae]MDY6134319.1 hypothetical protein [Campylobacter lanienae]
MIVAAIQSIDNKNSEQIVVVDGKIIKNDKEKSSHLNQLFDTIFDIDIPDNDEKMLVLKNGQYFCYIYHPENDDIGRRRRALILFDKETNLEIQKQTIDVLGLSWDKFYKLQRECKRKKLNPIVILALIAAVAMIFVLLRG